MNTTLSNGDTAIPVEKCLDREGSNVIMGYDFAMTFAGIIDSLCDQVYGKDSDHMDRDWARWLRVQADAVRPTTPTAAPADATDGEGEG